MMKSQFHWERKVIKLALQIWLPLNGNTNNLGLTPTSVSAGTPSYTDGKIGQCLGSGKIVFNVQNNLITRLG